MRYRASFAALPLVLLAAIPAQAQTIALTPAQIAQIFCIASLGNDMAPVEPLLTPALSAILAQAKAASAASAVAHPGDKPPLGDDVQWRSYPEYADGCTVGESTIEADTASVAITYSSTVYQEDYTNLLLLKPVTSQDGTPAVWRIDDIDMAEGNFMRQWLIDAARL